LNGSDKGWSVKRARQEEEFSRCEKELHEIRRKEIGSMTR
jgi:hypothetical protein